MRQEGHVLIYPSVRRVRPHVHGQPSQPHASARRIQWTLRPTPRSLAAQITAVSPAAVLRPCASTAMVVTVNVNTGSVVLNAPVAVVGIPFHAFAHPRTRYRLERAVLQGKAEFNAHTTCPNGKGALCAFFFRTPFAVSPSTLCASPGHFFFPPLFSLLPTVLLWTSACCLHGRSPGGLRQGAAERPHPADARPRGVRPNRSPRRDLGAGAYVLAACMLGDLTAPGARIAGARRVLSPRPARYDGVPRGLQDARWPAADHARQVIDPLPAPRP